MKKWRTKLYLSVLGILLLITAFFAIRGSSALVLTDNGTGEVLAAYRIVDGGKFSVRFTHSVNKSPVYETYEARGDEIYLVESRYYAFGAGVETAVAPDETLTYGEDGVMIVTNPGRLMRDLVYIVGTISDHTLLIGREEISLTEVCGKDKSVRFEYKP